MSLPTLLAFAQAMTGPAALSRGDGLSLTWGQNKTPPYLATYHNGPESAPFLKLVCAQWRLMLRQAPEIVAKVGAVRLSCASVELSAELNRAPTVDELYTLTSSWHRPVWPNAPADLDSVGKPAVLHDARAIVAAWGLARAVNVPLEGGVGRPRWPIAGDYAAWRDAADLAHSLRRDVLAWDGGW
jgi:hypothetical protein